MKDPIIVELESACPECGRDLSEREPKGCKIHEAFSALVLSFFQPRESFVTESGAVHTWGHGWHLQQNPVSKTHWLRMERPNTWEPL